ncbi:acyltransferase family protein [Tessaracoccus sp. MC1756]|uniref:acyltransferase family protein n=1 Tax=Tessaracoccus sp. MC1756 TaxID=2760311 RepID=UPI0016040A06|nr:acyltransferase family protein [Tessaracoccus sp. MC1756]MBB1509825.1 acyltransferase family protein [Tessaracoccus sp. MC1756]
MRAVAALAITNAHFDTIYPLGGLAAGGLLGDVIFFAVAGYSLNPRPGFVTWYVRRVIRIYPSVLVITGLYGIAGAYYITKSNWFQWFVFPTDYHFVASILILYPVMYAIQRFVSSVRGTVTALIVTVMMHVILYVTIYDRSYYHIDTVREPLIRFLFLEAMLVGALFRRAKGRLLNRPGVAHFVALLIATPVYLFTKLGFSSGALPAEWQLINQVALLVLLLLVFRVAAGSEAALRSLPSWVRAGAVALATITLEVYLVQYVLIDVASRLPFPLSWAAAVLMILGAAFVLNYVAHRISGGLEAALSRVTRTEVHRK